MIFGVPYVCPKETKDGRTYLVSSNVYLLSLSPERLHKFTSVMTTKMKAKLTPQVMAMTSSTWFVL